jgi:hypothetical protein
MSRSYNILGDRVDMLRVECTRCPRKGRYNVAKLIGQYGRRGNMTKWMSDLRGDCPNHNPPDARAVRSEGAVSVTLPPAWTCPPGSLALFIAVANVLSESGMVHNISQQIALIKSHIVGSDTL